TLEGAGTLHPGDAVRFTATGGQRVTAAEPAEILVWEMHATLPAQPGGGAPRLPPAPRPAPGRAAPRPGAGRWGASLAGPGGGGVAKAVLISGVPPLMVKTQANPGGLPKEVFDGLQAQLAANRSSTTTAVGPKGTQTVCPTVDVGGKTLPAAGDVTIVALMGVLGGALSATFAIQKLRGTSTPFPVPVPLPFFHLPPSPL